MTDPLDMPGPDAAADAEQMIAAALTLAGGGPVTTEWADRATGNDAVILARLRGWIAAGKVPGCPHQDTAPQLMWFAVEGCPIGCGPCVLAWVLFTVAGTPADSVCDVCGRPWPGPGKTERAMVFRKNPDQAVTVTYYACPPCLAAEAAP